MRREPLSHLVANTICYISLCHSELQGRRPITMTSEFTANSNCVRQFAKAENEKKVTASVISGFPHRRPVMRKITKYKYLPR